MRTSVGRTMRAVVVAATVLTIGLPLAPSVTSAEIPTSAETPSSAEVLTGAGDGDDIIFDSSGSDVIDEWNGSDTVNLDEAGDTITAAAQEDDLGAGVAEDVIAEDVIAEDVTTTDSTTDTTTDSIDRDIAAVGVDPDGGPEDCAGDSTDTISGACAFDLTGPSITDVSIPAWISAGETLTITWRVADPDGVAMTYLSIGGAWGWITSWCGFAVNGEPIDGTEFDGTYRLECALPANAANGTYTLFFSAFDSLSNVSLWDSSTQYNFEVVNGSNDIDPVSISEVTAETSPEGEILVRFRAVDESGAAGLWALLAWGGNDPSGDLFYNFASWTGLHFESLSMERVSGDEFDGIWEQRFRTREFTPSGNYGVWIGSVDTVGNRHFTSYEPTIRI